MVNVTRQKFDILIRLNVVHVCTFFPKITTTLASTNSLLHTSSSVHAYVTNNNL